MLPCLSNNTSIAVSIVYSRSMLIDDRYRSGQAVSLASNIALSTS